MSLKGRVRIKAESAPTRTRPGSEGFVAGTGPRGQSAALRPSPRPRGPSLAGRLADRSSPLLSSLLRAAPARPLGRRLPAASSPRGAPAAGASASPGPPGARCPPPSRCLGDAAAELPRRSRYGGREGTQDREGARHPRGVGGGRKAILKLGP